MAFRFFLLVWMRFGISWRGHAGLDQGYDAGGAADGMTRGLLFPAIPAQRLFVSPRLHDPVGLTSLHLGHSVIMASIPPA